MRYSPKSASGYPVAILSFYRMAPAFASRVLDGNEVALRHLPEEVSLCVCDRIVCRKPRENGPNRASIGSIFMGGGIATMHYIGMDTMEVSRFHRKSPAIAPGFFVSGHLFYRCFEGAAIGDSSGE